MGDKEHEGFITEFLGSATTVSLDGRSEGEGYVTELPKDKREDRQEGQGTRGAPWGMKPSLKAMADEVGVDFDRFMDSLQNNKSDQEIAQEFAVSPRSIAHLRDHFMRFGIDSVAGQD